MNKRSVMNNNINFTGQTTPDFRRNTKLALGGKCLGLKRNEEKTRTLDKSPTMGTSWDWNLSAQIK